MVVSWKLITKKTEFLVRMCVFCYIMLILFLIFRPCQSAVNLYLAVLSTMMGQYLHTRYLLRWNADLLFEPEKICLWFSYWICYRFVMIGVRALKITTLQQQRPAFSCTCRRYILTSMISYIRDHLFYSIH